MNDKILSIKTEEVQRDNHHTYYNHRYEPTPYDVLDLIFDTYELTAQGSIVDFGCGLGRLNFYCNYRFHCYATGVELNPKYYESAKKNRSIYHGSKRDKIEFLNIAAQDYKVKDRDNYFYFFRPFSSEIFSKVVCNIISSLEKAQRECTIILFYPDIEYLYYLENYTPFELIDEKPIPLSKDEKDRFYVYSYELK